MITENQYYMEWTDSDQVSAAAVAQKYKASRRIVVVVHTEDNQVVLKKRKFVTPEDITGVQFVAILRRHLDVGPTHAIFLFFRDSRGVADLQKCMVDYRHHFDNDSVLHLVCAKENAFG